MLPDDVPKPPWKTILLASASISTYAGLQIALLLQDLSKGSQFISNLPPPTVTPLLTTAASLAGLAMFIVFTIIASTAAIAFGYWKQHRANKRESNI